MDLAIVDQELMVFRFETSVGSLTVPISMTTEAGSAQSEQAVYATLKQVLLEALDQVELYVTGPVGL